MPASIKSQVSISLQLPVISCLDNDKVVPLVITIVFLVNSLQALMGATNSSVMKAAACGTWLGDFITAWMVSYISLLSV